MFRFNVCKAKSRMSTEWCEHYYTSTLFLWRRSYRDTISIRKGVICSPWLLRRQCVVETMPLKCEKKAKRTFVTIIHCFKKHSIYTLDSSDHIRYLVFKYESTVCTIFNIDSQNSTRLKCKFLFSQNVDLALRRISYIIFHFFLHFFIYLRK